MAAERTTKEQEIQNVLKEYPLTYPIAVALVLVALGILIGVALFGSGGVFANDNGYGANVYTSVISTIVTVGFIDRLNRRRDEKRELQELQQQLIRDAGSTSNETAKNAVHQLRKRKWLEDENGLLVGENLWGANLEAADLRGANLRGASFWGANLRGADLRGTNLQGASLFKAQLKGANLQGANLQEANLLEADLRETILADTNLQKANLEQTRLQGASLFGASLQDASLWGAKLIGAKGVNLYRAKLSIDTTLPDGSLWSPDTDLTKFGAIVE